MGEFLIAFLLMVAVVVPLVFWAVRADRRQREAEPVAGRKEEVA